MSQEFGGDEACFNGLADSDVVGDEDADRVLAQGEHERHVLVGARLDSYAGEGSEGSGAGAEADP